MSLFASISSISKVNNTSSLNKNSFSNVSTSNQFGNEQVAVLGLVSGLVFNLATALEKAGL